jgi:hypothetical protein
MTASLFRVGTETVHNDPADTVGPGQVLPIYIKGGASPIGGRNGGFLKISRNRLPPHCALEPPEIGSNGSTLNRECVMKR